MQSQLLRLNPILFALSVAQNVSHSTTLNPYLKRAIIEKHLVPTRAERNCGQHVQPEEAHDWYPKDYIPHKISNPGLSIFSHAQELRTSSTSPMLMSQHQAICDQSGIAQHGGALGSMEHSAAHQETLPSAIILIGLILFPTKLPENRSHVEQS